MMKFPAKLLLFGEHTVNLGSQALAIPLWRFGGEWRFLPEEKMEKREAMQMELPRFVEHLFRLRQNGDLASSFEVERFQNDLATGLIFESDIPTGYGAGSSGALVAAVFAKYAALQRDFQSLGNLENLKQSFAKMESFFHGTSSGTDPLVCFLKQPVLLSKTEIKVISSKEQKATEDSELFLLDTGIRRQATPFIEYFLKQNESKIFREKCATDLLPAVDEGISSCLSGDAKKLMESIHQIGYFQFEYLEKLIPPAFREIWKTGLSDDLFKLKICGAGGGGFILGITNDFEKLKRIHPDLKLLKLKDKV